MKKLLSLGLVLMMVVSAFALTAISSSAGEGIVQDGLVSWYDAKTFNGTTWTDKKGDNDIVECIGKFQNGVYILDKQQQPLPLELYTGPVSGDAFSIEMSLGEFERFGTNWATLLCNNAGLTNEKLALFTNASSGNLNFKTSNLPSSGRAVVADAEKNLANSTITFTYQVAGDSCIYINGELKAKKTNTGNASNGNADIASPTNFVLCCSDAKKTVRAEFKSLRFYGKALTAAEVKQNYAADTASPVESFNIKPFVSGTVKGWENWPKGKEQTQLLITIPGDEKGKFNSKDYTWKISVSEGSTVKTIESKVSSAGGYFKGAYIYRFVPCTLEGDNQFVPKAGTNYSVQVEIYKGSDLVAKSDKVAGFETAADFVPVVPTPPAPPTPPTPPVTGDATAVVAVLAAVALFGSAVIITKKVLA